MNKKQMYYSGDKVIMQSDHFPDDQLKGFKKGDKAIILDAIQVEKDIWEVDVEIVKNKSSCLVLGKEVKVYKKTPLKLEQKNKIRLGSFNQMLSQDETFALYQKIKKMNQKNKKSLLFKDNKVKFESKEDIDIALTILAKVLKPFYHLD